MKRKLSLSDAQALLERVTYRPGFVLALTSVSPNVVELRLHAWVHDATAAEGEFRVFYDIGTSRHFVATTPSHTIECDLPAATLRAGQRYERAVIESCDERRFLGLVRGFLTEVELHERDEWFKLDGEPIFDPHADR